MQSRIEERHLDHKVEREKYIILVLLQETTYSILISLLNVPIFLINSLPKMNSDSLLHYNLAIGAMVAGEKDMQ